MSFNKGFEKTAFIGAIGAGLRAAGGAISSAIGLGARAVGRGLVRAGSGNLSKPITTMDKVFAAAAGSSALADGGDQMKKMRDAATR